MVPKAEIAFCAHSAEAFAALASGRVDAAVIPIENSLAGSVTEHFDLLLEYDLKIDREIRLRIHHNLIVLPGTKMEALRQVYSHPIALAQCRHFLASHEHVQALPSYDTAGSVKSMMAQGKRDHAAIASASAAKHYGAEILASNIEDDPMNFTRFYLIHRAADAATAADANKVSLAFALENRPGSLVEALQAIARLGANLTKIESRPVPGRPWEYIFYVDAQLAAAGEDLRIVEALSSHCSMVKELGLYREHEEK